MSFIKLGTCCREKSRITLSIKQLEEDPLLETLDKVIPQVWPTYSLEHSLVLCKY